MAQSIQGKTAIVTGAGSGINLAFASLLLKKGCNVVLADLSLRPEAKDLVEAYSPNEPGRPRAVFQKTNVTKWEELDRMFDFAEGEFGNIDIVCPGAGVYDPPWSNFFHPPGSESSRDSPKGNSYAVLDINLTHPIRTTQIAISRFLNASNPPSYSANLKSIIHISSIAGQTTPLPTPLYNASKHAINGFVRSLAQLEKAIGIRVAAVAPGVIKTPLWTDNPDKFKAVDSEKDEWIEPEEVAEVMLALVNEKEISTVFGAEGAENAGLIRIEGGTILEVSKGRVRDVQAYNDPGPMGRPGNTAANMGELEAEVWDELGKPKWGIVD